MRHICEHYAEEEHLCTVSFTGESVIKIQKKIISMNSFILFVEMPELSLITIEKRITSTVPFPAVSSLCRRGQ